MAGEGSRPRPYQVEGGGPNPPFGEDPFQRIVNVHWRVGASGGVFVSGSFDSTIHYARVPTKDSPQNWQNLGSFDFTPGGGSAGIYAASYAKVNGTPTFLLGGSNDHGQVEGWSGIIMLSNDGLHWTTVLTVWEEHSNNATVFNLVWDVNENAFYADVNVLASTVGDFARRLYRSPDGHAWTRINIGTPPVFPNDVFHTHCNGKKPGVEDGRYGYDAVNDILMDVSGGDSVEITTASDSVVVPVDVYNNTVAYSGGIWITAGADKDPSFPGKPAIVSSIDNGQTWAAVPFESTEVDIGDIEVVVGAPIEDFR